jgi:hypothetical protein
LESKTSFGLLKTIVQNLFWTPFMLNLMAVTHSAPYTLMNRPEQRFSKITQANAQLLCQTIELNEAAKVLLQACPISADYIQQLVDKELYTDAVNVLAHALPKREAVWWACLCARKTLTATSLATESKTIELAEAWVYKPSEENRKLLIPIAETAHFKNAASWAAVAAFWSGNNISLTPEITIPATEGLTAKAVTGAIITAAVSDKPENIASNYQLFLKQGIDIACGGDGRLSP